jgi:hypothetical protein
VSDFGTQKHQKVFYSILYSLPSEFLKLILRLNILLKKLLNLNIKKYYIVYSLFIDNNPDLLHLCTVPKSATYFSGE